MTRELKKTVDGDEERETLMRKRKRYRPRDSSLGRGETECLWRMTTTTEVEATRHVYVTNVLVIEKKRTRRKLNIRPCAVLRFGSGVIDGISPLVFFHFIW